MLSENQHLRRAQASAAEADLRHSVVRALAELLSKELEGTPNWRQGWYSGDQPQAQGQSPARLLESIRLFLEPRVRSWPVNMREYLSKNLASLVGIRPAGQQQQQEPQNYVGRLRQIEPPFGAVLYGMLNPQLEKSAQEASRTKRVLSLIEEVSASSGKAMVESAAAGEPATDVVQIALYGPLQASVAEPFTLDLWAFLSAQREKIESLAKRMGQRKTAGSTANLERESTLALQLYSPQLKIERPVRALAWTGSEAVESFECMVIAQYAWQISGNAVITLNGLLIARIDFQLPVGERAGDARGALAQTATVPQTAFASYARANRIDVLRCVQGIKYGAPHLRIEIDVDSIRAGENWEEKLYAYISTSDVFYLFWSHAAALSEWVDREWRYGFHLKGIDFIHPCPLESPELAPPPPELSALHFGDRYLMFILAEQQIQSEKAKAARNVLGSFAQ